MKPLGRIGGHERAVIEQRSATGYRGSGLAHFADTESTLRALLEILLPGVAESIDLVSFVDQHVGDPMGRGDRSPGGSSETELFVEGLVALNGVSFVAWTPDDKRSLVRRMRRGEADEELGLAAKDFVDRILDKALAGYLAHPDTWRRIGFTGPAYPEGYAWIGPAGAVARHRQAPGWDKL